ncbi:MAG: hypothetical protein L0Y39_12575 [Methylococcaceae bacterium]|nr:hypothetical protein [Methylococcaceae bacterium]
MWTGAHWNANEVNARRRTFKLSRIIKAEAEEWRDKPGESEEERNKNRKIAEALDKWARKSEDKSKLDAAFAMFKNIAQVDTGELDRDRFALNCGI